MKRGLQRLVRRLIASNRHAVDLYRIAHRLYAAGHPTTALFVTALNRVVTAAEIHPAAAFGEGFEILHPNGVFISRAARGGKNVKIFQQVTLGESWGDNPGAPQLGDHVVVFGGAKILGDVSIGSNVRIGANAVVLKDVPDGAVAVGVPARVISIYGESVPPAPRPSDRSTADL